MKKNRKILSAFMAFVIMFAQIPMFAIPASSTNRNGKIMVSLGDSYSSGEGVEPFYGQDLYNEARSENENFLAHRSESSWSGQLKLKGVSGTMKDHMDENWFFVASSGAETVHFKGRKGYNEDGSDHKGNQKKTYNKYGVKNTVYLKPQLKVFDQFQKNEVDYVTLTIGGNDVGFGDIITSAVVEGNAFLNPSALAVMLNNAWYHFYEKGGAKDNIRQAYNDVRTAAGEKTHIIVAGYPKLVNTLHIPQSHFTMAEAMLINNSCSKFNDEIESIINNMRKKDNRIHFADVEDAFDDHGAYAIKPYINGIMFNQDYDIDKSVVSAYSMHPNREGTKAYAKCVQAVIDEIEKDESNGSSTKFKGTAIAKKLLGNTWFFADNLNTGLLDRISFKSDGTLEEVVTQEMGENTYTAKCKVIDNNTISYTIKPKDGLKTTTTLSLDKKGYIIATYQNSQVNHYETMLLNYKDFKGFDGTNPKLSKTLIGTWKFSKNKLFDAIEFYKNEGNVKAFIHGKNGEGENNLYVGVYTENFAKIVISDTDEETIILYIDKISDTKFQVIRFYQNNYKMDTSFATLTKEQS